MSEQYTGHTLAWAQYGGRNLYHLLRGEQDKIGPFHKSVCGNYANANGWHTTSLALGPRDRLCAKCERSYNKTRETKPAKVERSKSWHLVTVYTDGSTFEDYFVSEGAAKRFVRECKQHAAKYVGPALGVRHIMSYTLTQEDVEACSECANKASECVCIQDNVEESE